MTWRKLAFLFLIGAPLASVGDVFHVRTQTTFYPPEGPVPFIQGMPFWIPFVFGVAAAGFGIIYQLAKRLLGAGHFKQGATVAELIVAGIVYPLLHIGSGYVCHWGFPLADMPLASLAILTWYLLDRSFGGFLVCLFVALIGVSAEISLVHLGIFMFLDRADQVFGVATWLGWIYMAGGLAVGRFVERGGAYGD